MRNTIGRLTLCEMRMPHVLLYAILMLLSGCAINTSGDFCDIYQPVYADYERDTPETLRQIEFNNVVFDKDCN